ncbi:hypothetical protein GF351_05320, partial [Candidatus Woesearchaeota archaeon]|nr:hypothetical protein [Candidatus Woesearchaeota archaeon]
MIEEIKYSLQNIKHRKLRSFLTMLSIMIGITAIYAIMSFGMGINNYVNELAQEMGTDKLWISPKSAGVPGMDDNFYLTEEDMDFVSKINGVDKISAWYIGVAEVEHRDERKYNFLAGLNPEDSEFVEELATIEVISGRRLKKGDLKKAVLGYNYMEEDKIFRRRVRLGDKIEINEEKFEVVGFYSEVGNPQDDGNIYLTMEGYESLYPDQEGKYGALMLSSAGGVDPRDLAEKIEDKLRKFKDQEEGKEDFFVQSFEDVIETFGAIFSVIVGVLILVALVSVVVASVNIMNTMYTA